jgi:flagellin-specific chaperone FliS
MGQQYAYETGVQLQRFNDMITKSSKMLSSLGSQERAENLKELYNIVNTPTDEKRRTDMLLNLTKKFNKGGLVSKP